MNCTIHYNDRLQGHARLTPGEIARLTLKGYTITEEQA